MIAAPMAGLEPENISAEVTADGRLILHGSLRSMLKEVKELLLDEWSVGVYHRELVLPVTVDAVCASVTYGNGVLTGPAMQIDLDYIGGGESCYGSVRYWLKGGLDGNLQISTFAHCASSF
jgi:Hsp20/alpha crystallin family